MEQWDLYTKDRVLTGETHRRGDPLPKDRYHLAVHVWIRNAKGQYLMSQRAADRAAYPLMWESPGGSVLKGEDSLAGALREVKEEVGIVLSQENGRMVFSETRDEGFPYIMDVWLFDYDGPVCLENATTDEVAWCRWMGAEEIRTLFAAGKVVDSPAYFGAVQEDKTFGAYMNSYNIDFWNALDELVNNAEIIIDRPKGTSHPKYPDFIYRVDYGYLKDTSSMDGSGIDVWVGSCEKKVDAIMCIVDLMKKDSEIKILIGCTEEEKSIVYETHNETPFMKGVLIRR